MSCEAPSCLLVVIQAINWTHCAFPTDHFSHQPFQSSDSQRKTWNSPDISLAGVEATFAIECCISKLMQGHGYASQPHLVTSIRSAYSNEMIRDKQSLLVAAGFGRSNIQSIAIDMASEGSASYQGFVVQQNAKVHAGHVYSNVTNNYPSQPAISTELSLRYSSAFGRSDPAPANGSVHEDFVGAARQGQGTTRLEYLLSRGANVDARDESGLTALYHAAFRGDRGNVQVLLQHGADVNSGHHLLGTPVAVAALRGHLEVAETLLLFKADTFRTLPLVGSALHCACFAGDTGIFNSILHDASQYDYLASYREINLKAFSIISTTDLKPSGILRLIMKELDFEGHRIRCSIRCSPIFLAAERCNLDILHLRCSAYHHDCFLPGLWEFSDRENQAANSERPQRRIKSSWASVESRSGRSVVSKGSTSSAWSTLGFPLAAREPPRSTLLMWAAASLNLPLISHLLEIGASANVTDVFGRTALHYAAEPLLEATFKDIEECVRLLLATQASLPSIQIAQKPPPVIYIKSPLELVVGKDHAALDPRTSFKWGLDIHRTCISSFLDPLKTDNERSKLAQLALLSALSHNMCPTDSIELLCKHAVGLSETLGSQIESVVMDAALFHALSSSASEPVILILLDHGASPNAETYGLPLVTAIFSEASEDVVTALLERGADPNFCPKSGVPITPLECAKQRYRRDMIALFTRHDTVSNLPDLRPSHPTGPRTAEASLRLIQSPHSPTSLTVPGSLNDADEEDELDSPDDFVYELSPTDSVGPSRLWFSGISPFPLSRFRSHSKQK